VPMRAASRLLERLCSNASAGASCSAAQRSVWSAGWVAAAVRQHHSSAVSGSAGAKPLWSAAVRTLHQSIASQCTVQAAGTCRALTHHAQSVRSVAASQRSLWPAAARAVCTASRAAAARAPGSPRQVAARATPAQPAGRAWSSICRGNEAVHTRCVPARRCLSSMRLISAGFGFQSHTLSHLAPETVGSIVLQRTSNTMCHTKPRHTVCKSGSMRQDHGAPVRPHRPRFFCLLRRSLAMQSAVSRAALARRRDAASGAAVIRRGYATWSDIAPRGWSRHGGFRVMQQRGADVDPMTVVYTLMGVYPLQPTASHNPDLSPGLRSNATCIPGGVA